MDVEEYKTVKYLAPQFESLYVKFCKQRHNKLYNACFGTLNQAIFTSDELTINAILIDLLDCYREFKSVLNKVPSNIDLADVLHCCVLYDKQDCLKYLVQRYGVFKIYADKFILYKKYPESFDILMRNYSIMDTYNYIFYF
jgi:hypothetical protein